MYTVQATTRLGGGRVEGVAGMTSPVETIVSSATVMTPSGSTATFVTTSHCLEVADKRDGRPIIFAFNGGPGAAAGFLDIGFLGPYGLEFADGVRPGTHPPFRINVAADTILDTADVVLIDPPGTGLARLNPETDPKDFYGSIQDASATLAVIMDWCDRNDRENSPRYLLGESYGSVRAVEVLGRSLGGPTEGGWLPGMSFNGAILVGSVLDLARTMHGDLGFVQRTTAYAASAWYHGIAGAGASLEAHVAQARTFANRELVVAMHEGLRLGGAHRRSITDRLSEAIGLPTGLLLRNNLRITAEEFSKELLPSGRIGPFDARYTASRQAIGADVVADDAGMGQFSAAFAHATRTRLRDLNVAKAADYKLIDFASVGTPWDWGSGPGIVAPPDHVSRLSTALDRDPELRVLFANGYFDLVTPLGSAEYVAAQVEPDASRVTVTPFVAGHMPYVGDEARKALTQSVRAFVTTGGPAPANS
ncbi:hypothetical protein [Paenarthrobacter sp. JL.01a]|uniref:hypothetical protein n=1 Tax=Paenarthrobacter sp. JL.01a TaxID=2979324 RepID=UPI0021CA82DA|nr:hypothetical protein [Paenarthrobacter sp. JL.01a]UXM93487.1 hypothetical protein N5P29_09355 [Paenarthrobacter sp. JL.01a]